MRCNKAVPLFDAVMIPMQGKLIMIRGKCPVCGLTINRGGRRCDLPAKNHLTVHKFLEDLVGIKELSLSRYWFLLRHGLLWADGTSFERVICTGKELS